MILVLLCYKTDVTPGGKTAVHRPFDPIPRSLSHPISASPLCPHSVKHCKRFELCKGLFLNTYFVHNVKPESVYFGKKMFCVSNHSFIEKKKETIKKKVHLL